MSRNRAETGPVTVFKLTTQENLTRAGKANETKWGPGVTHSGTGEGRLCSPGYIHAYLTPELAVLLNPIHADITSPKLWLCHVPEIAKNDNDLKIGAVSLTTIREIPLPVFTKEQKAIFAILCVEAAFKDRGCIDPRWQSWADGYKSGLDRSEATAAAADYAARHAYYAVAADYAAAHAADAADAAAAADYVYTVYGAACYAVAAAYYVHAAAHAADAADAAARSSPINLPELARTAMTYR